MLRYSSAIAALLTLTFCLAFVGDADAQNPRAEALKVLAKFSAEPTVLDAQQAAARYARVNPDAYDSWMSAARHAYWLPERLEGIVRTLNQDGRDVRTSSSGAPSDLISRDERTQFQVRAEWDFTRIVYNKDQIRAARQIERLVNQREDILTTVNKLYFARRQLQVEVEMNPPQTVQKAIRQQLRLDGLTADLDALTGGWFSKSLPKS